MSRMYIDPDQDIQELLGSSLPDTVPPSVDDIRFITQRPQPEITMIVGQISSLLEAISDTKRGTDALVSKLQNQGWFKRMCNTITGKNKATKEEIRHNQDRIVGYLSQTVAKLFELRVIDEQIMLSLNNRLNQVYSMLFAVQTEQMYMKAQIAGLMKTQNLMIKEINAVDNYSKLITKIEHGFYPTNNRLLSICLVLSQLNERDLNNDENISILKTVLYHANIVNSTTITLKECIMCVLSMNETDIGSVYIELCNYRDTFPANIFVEVIEEYHFLSKIEKASINKDYIIEAIMSKYHLNARALLSYSDLLDCFITSKTDSIVDASAISNNLENPSIGFNDDNWSIIEQQLVPNEYFEVENKQEEHLRPGEYYGIDGVKRNKYDNIRDKSLLETIVDSIFGEID